MREAELEERRALERTLGLGAGLIVDAGQLHEQAVTLHSLDHGLVHAHAVNTAANDLDDAFVAAIEGLVHLLLDRSSIIRIGDLCENGLTQRVLVHAKREGRTTLKVKS